MEFIGFSVYNIMSYANNDSFASSFPLWMPFISLSCLISVAKTPNTMLNRSGERGRPCLVPDLSGKALSFCPLSMISVSYTHLTLPTIVEWCRSRWSPYH